MRPFLQTLPQAEIDAAVRRMPNPQTARRWRDAARDGIPAAELAVADAELRTMLARMQETLARETWLAGDAYSLADINIAPFVHLIHSIDSVKLLQEVDKQGSKNGRIIPCLLQVHIAQEETKFGFSAEEIETLLKSPELADLKSIQLVGLMGMASFTDNQQQIRKEFKLLNELFEKLKRQTLPTNVRMTELSMGMSGDYRIAIEEGSTMVRVGSAIFGNRNYTLE